MSGVSRLVLVALLASLATRAGADEPVSPPAALPYPTVVGDAVDPGNHAHWPVRVRRPERIEWSIELGKTPGMALPGTDGSVCVVDGAGSLRFLDPATGKTEFAVPGAAGHKNESSGVRGPDGTVYFGNHDFVQAVEQNGEPLWRTELRAGRLLRPPLLSRDGQSLYVIGEHLSCARLNTKTGLVDWMRRDFKRPWSSMMLDHRDRFMMTTGRTAVHIEAGPTKWYLRTISTHIMSVGDRLVNITGRRSGCFSLEGKRRVIWSTEFPAEGLGLALGDDGDVRLSLANGDLARIDMDGRVVWRRHLSETRLRPPVTTAGGDTLVMDAGGVLYLVDADGGVEASLPLGGPAPGWRPAVAPDGSIYVSLDTRLVKVSGPLPPAVPLPVARDLMVVANSFVVDVWHNGERVPRDARKMIGNPAGAVTERVTCDVLPGDWLVFHVVASPSLKASDRYFGCAARRFDKTVAFVSSSATGNWFVCDDLADVRAFVASRDAGTGNPARAQAAPWSGAATRWQSALRAAFAGQALWGDQPSTWIKVHVPLE